MTASTQSCESEERLGKYRVHPAAALFPILIESEYDELLCSMNLYGQRVPILVDGDVLLDGRNRLKVCLELGMEPKVQQFDHSVSAIQAIYDLNINRRTLTDDQIVVISAQLMAMKEAERAQLAKKEAGKQFHRGSAKPEKVDTNSYPPFSGKNERSTVGKIATDAKVSYHQNSLRK